MAIQAAPRSFILLAFAFAAFGIQAQPIQRSAAEVRAFRAENPCPVTGRTRGPCPGWRLIIQSRCALVAETTDPNMTWLSVEDHKWKTFVDTRECRKLRWLANTPLLSRELLRPESAAQSLAQGQRQIKAQSLPCRCQVREAE